MNNIENSRKYLQTFMNSHYRDYFQTMNEYRTHHGYGDFLNFSEINQCMRNIVGIMEDDFSDIRIPEKFATPQLLIQTVTKFISLLESYNPIFDKSMKSCSNTGPIPEPLYQINKRRLDTISACKHFIKMANKELSEVQFMSDDLKKITLIQLLRFMKNLSIGSWITLISISFSFILFAINGVTAISRINELETDIEKYKKQSYIEKEENDSLRESLSTIKYEMDKLRQQVNDLTVKKEETHKE